MRKARAAGYDNVETKQSSLRRAGRWGDQGGIGRATSPAAGVSTSNIDASQSIGKSPTSPTLSTKLIPAGGAGTASPNGFSISRGSLSSALRTWAGFASARMGFMAQQ